MSICQPLTLRWNRKMTAVVYQGLNGAAEQASRMLNQVADLRTLVDRSPWQAGWEVTSKR
jgi:hypothetical protein